MPIKMKSNYFPHDYNARSNPKLLKLQMVMGALGLAIFWCVIEMLWENAGFLPCMYDAIAYDLRWANAGEVQRVIEEFDLFETDGKRFWSPSVLSRMEVRQLISERNAKNGKEGGIQSGKSRRKNATASGDRTIVEAAASETRSTDEARASDNESEQEIRASKAESKKEINKDNKVKKDNKEYDNSGEEDEERNRILELFFFKNWISPEYELNRFWDHYCQTNWTTADGKTITDRIRIANNWKPEKTDRRFDVGFLNWYKMIYECVKRKCVLEKPYEMLSGLNRVVLTENSQSLLISYKTKELAAIISDFVLDNNLSGKYKIDWKYMN